MNMALSVAENLTGKSPSLRRVSVNGDQQQKSGLFGKRKVAEPSLVFTFSRDDSVSNNHDLEGNDVASVFSEGSQNFNLKGYSEDINNMKLGSVASFRTTNTQASTHEEELEILRRQRFFDFLRSDQMDQYANQCLGHS